MRSVFAGLLVLVVLVFVVDAQGQENVLGAGTQIVDKGASWTPTQGSLEKIRDKCKNLQAPDLGECFISGMGGEGASPQAVAFARRAGNLAYMSRFVESGRVDVAYVDYPFRANENYSWFLVNGVPDLIDVDDPIYNPKSGLEKDQRYVLLSKSYPNLTLWPDDRTSRRAPMVKGLRGQGQRFVISYRITSGCRTCEYLGTAWLGFDFEQNGKFMSTKFLGIEKAPRTSAAISQDASVEQGYTNPKKPVEVKAGQTFTIVLGANHTTGYRWQVAGGVNSSLLDLIGTVYKAADDEKIGAGGKEVWTFLAKNKGRAKISFDYVRPWEKQTGGKTTSFEIVIQ